MSQSVAPQLTITGAVYHSRPLVASIGDVCIHPGANRTRYIDGYVYDGRAWRKLDLKSFGYQVARLFDESGEVGFLMRGIEAILIRHKGAPVYYEKVGRGSSYVFRGLSFSSFFR